MSKIKKKFDNLKLENKKALIPFITAGFPNNNICQSIINKLPSMGADIIEIGMPFSDPMAEGPIIQTSSKLSIDMGHTMMKTFEIVKDFRRIDINTPIVLMGYYNPIYRFGRDKFLQNCRELGVDGLIIVDLPPEHDDELCINAKELGIDFVRLVTPTTNQERLKIILNNSSGFLYYVSITGITGTKKPEIGPLKESLDFVREFTHLPIAVGFGIKTPKQVSLINEFSDAVVVGSALVNTILNGLENDECDEFIINEALAFISNMKTN